MKKIEIIMKRKIPFSKGTRRERLKRGEIFIDKRIIYISMRTTTLLMKMIVKHKRSSSWL
jgi:hypothetical protein